MNFQDYQNMQIFFELVETERDIKPNGDLQRKEKTESEKKIMNVKKNFWHATFEMITCNLNRKKNGFSLCRNYLFL